MYRFLSYIHAYGIITTSIYLTSLSLPYAVESNMVAQNVRAYVVARKVYTWWRGMFTNSTVHSTCIVRGTKCLHIITQNVHVITDDTKCLQMVAHGECSHMVAQNVLLW